MSSTLLSGTVIKSRVVMPVPETSGGGGGTVITDGVSIQGDGSAGSPVAIKTGYLGSAAFVGVGSFDAAGSAAAAQASAIASSAASLATHTSDTSNPHSVTAAQVAAWALEGTSTLTNTTTITSNAGGRLNFNGTYTGTGTYMLINPSITASSNGQVMTGVNISMPFNSGGFTNLQSRPLTFSIGASLSSSFSWDQSGNGFWDVSTSGTEYYIRSGGINHVIMSNAGRLTFLSGAGQTAGNAILVSPSFSNTASVGVTYRTLTVAPTINATGGTSTVVGVYYAPTLTAVTGVTHYGLLVVPSACLNGFGTGTPTAVVDIAASSTARASLRIQSGTAPTTPNNGDIWFDGTDLKLRSGGVTYTLTKV